jgi:hypothetical protein
MSGTEKLLSFRCGWCCFKVKIGDQISSDHHGLVVWCAAKLLGITSTSKGSVSIASKSFCGPVTVVQSVRKEWRVTTTAKCP